MGLLYTNMKVFHYKDKLDSLPQENENILSPIHIRIKPTNKCSQNCRYCAYRADGLQLGKDMDIKDVIPREKMLEIIEDVSEMGVQAITFSGGGEPFVYPYMLDTIKALIKTDIKFASLSNGSHLTGEVAELFAHNATWLRLSIDGWDGASYAKYRGVSEDSFDKVMNNIQAFAGYNGSCYLGVSIIVDQGNAEHIFELASRLKDVGAHSVKIAPCIVSNEGHENNVYHESIFDTVKSQAKKAMDELSDDTFEVYDSYHTQLESFKKNYTWCPYMQVLPVIGADQNIYPCQDKAYNLDEGLIGSIKDVRFKDFWFNNKDKFFKVNPSVHCNHHCVADGKNRLINDYLQTDKDHLGFV